MNQEKRRVTRKRKRKVVAKERFQKKVYLRKEQREVDGNIAELRAVKTYDKKPVKLPILPNPLCQTCNLRPRAHGSSRCADCSKDYATIKLPTWV